MYRPPCFQRERIPFSHYASAPLIATTKRTKRAFPHRPNVIAPSASTWAGLFPDAVLYMDHQVCFVNKPAGLLSQSDVSGSKDDLLTLTRTFVRGYYHKPGKVYLGLVCSYMCVEKGRK